MRTTIVLFSLLAACGVDVPPALLPIDGAPPPPSLTLSATPTGVGVAATLSATGASPGDRVTFLQSSVGFGTFCPAWLPAACIQLLPAVQVIGRATADASGTASYSFTPAARASDRRFAVQAVVQATSATSAAITAWIAPVGTDLSPSADVDQDGVTRGEGDCHDGDPSVAPGQPDPIGDRIDADCDGADGTDADHDGALSALSGGDDCDDQDGTIYPGKAEACDTRDDDCDGVIDQGFADADGSGLPDCAEVAVLVTAGFIAHDLPLWTCEGELPVSREFAGFEAAVTATGLGVVRVDEDPVNGVDAATLARYGAVVVHNGGWGDALTVGTLDALSANYSKPLIFVGDDTLGMVATTQQRHGRSDLYDYVHLSTFDHNGNNEFRGLGAEPASPAPSELVGPWGTIAAFDYVGDLDHGTLTGDGEIVLLTKVGVGAPVSWLIDDPLRRVAVVLPVSYNTNNACPVSTNDGLDQISALIQNALWWTMRLPGSN